MRLSISRLQVAVTAFIAIASATTELEDNPLATLDQRDLDALAIQINQDNSFVVLKAEAKAAYQTAHGLLISDEASSSLDAAIDELTFSSIQKAVNTDVYYPKVYWVDAGPRTWFGLDVPGGRYSYDNPDCIYRTIPIDHRLSYIVKGYRYSPGPTDVTFSLISDPNSQNTVTSLSGSNLVVDSDGSYTITINNSSENSTNHIQSTLLAKQLFIRNNLGDWTTEKPDSISVQLTSDASGHTPISNATILAAAKWNLQESIIDYGVGALGLKTTINAVNTLSSPSQSSTLGTLTSQASSFGHYKLDDDEALVATLTPGPADYWVFPATNPWIITTNPGNSQVSLNSVQSAANSNGTYTFVVSLQDPGVYNWINTTGLHEGTMMVRWQGLPTSSSSSTDSPAITTQVVTLAELSSILADGTRFVTPQERAEQLAQRAKGYAQRLEF
ncbi:uncharacterized protein N7443_008358 [Penicillium atrosanguineum]|uniref:DUF1214 domain-containing protein n=1 Tax=Penicillium atrosanguineum TaxID=1132637 RepID=A0A9W9U0T1_9EURO|nr:uncharacterized protein N7443_008358 [Penicillium atrosanguineum]KAJ5125282.1 hypothetical protein N7526_007459 [Penicillium atrosanguineum]KAJ5292405.1 hypothetical protein N7443_008358 [Penicillium atrosanguineum]KAJ5303571.1 hypothetical protein N7476_010370 [Penicillium atrosanguineum]